MEFRTAVNLSEPPAADDLPLTRKVADAERLTERENPPDQLMLCHNTIKMCPQGGHT